MTPRTARCLCSAAIAAGLAIAAHADVTQPPDAIFGLWGFPGSPVPLSSAFDLSSSDYQYLFDGYAHGGADPEADIQGHINYTGSSIPTFANMYASVTYYYKITGPADQYLAPVVLSVAGHASATGSGGAIASVYLGYFSGNNYINGLAYSAQAGAGGHPPTAEFSDSVHYDVYTDRVYGITVYALGGLGYTDGSFQAVADPIIEIDPTSPDHDLFTLTMSSNVPAPGTATMLGLAGLLTARRRRSSPR